MNAARTARRPAQRPALSSLNDAFFAALIVVGLLGAAFTVVDGDDVAAASTRSVAQLPPAAVAAQRQAASTAPTATAEAASVAATRGVSI